MKNIEYRFALLLSILSCLVFALPLAAADKTTLTSERAGISAPLIDEGDYYIHPDGRKIKFYRKQHVYAIETAPQTGTGFRAKSITSMARFKAQFGNRVSKVKSHRLGNSNIIRIDNSRKKSTSTLQKSRFDIQPSMLKSLDASIIGIQPVLANKKGKGDLLVTSKILIKLKNDAHASADIADLASRFNLIITRRLKTTGAVYQVDARNVAADTSDRFRLVRRVMSDASVDWAQPVFKSKPRKTAFQPNDSLFGKQWHLRNSGQGGSLCDSDCDADNAWGYGAASGFEGAASFSASGMVIAVIDDGVQLDHEDVAIWTNSGETINGMDDDGNGYIDDINGWDFVDDRLSPLLNPSANLTFCTNALTSGGDPSDANGIKCRCQDTDGSLGADGDPSPHPTSLCLDINDQVVTEQDDHGTAVAGLAAAQRNGLGVVGTGYSAQILPIRLISQFDGDQDNDFCARSVEAMTYAGRYADVVSNSWSVDEGTCPALDVVIESVVDGTLMESGANISKRASPLGSPVIFAAGNDASGWVKVTIPVSAGEHAYEWRFLRTIDTTGDAADEQSLDDSVWVDNIVFPDGSTEGFESGFPSGVNDFTLGCEIATVSCNGDCDVNDPNFPFQFLPDETCRLWEINTDPDFSRTGNSATINHSANKSPCNHSYMNILKSGPAGTVSFWIWVSTDLQGGADKVEFLVDGQEQLSFGDLARFVDNGVAYPANLAKVIAVGSSNSGDLSGISTANLASEERSSYSQYGLSLDVLAPSSNQHLGIVTTDRYDTGSPAVGYNLNTSIGAEANPGRYTDQFGGTSASAPIVSGIAAAMIATNASISAADVEQFLRASADKIGRRGVSAYVNDGTGNTRSPFYGYGRVNMFKALQAAQGLSNTPLTQACTPEPFSYSPVADLITPNFTPQAASGSCPVLGPRVVVIDDSFCIPIRASNGNLALVCL